MRQHADRDPVAEAGLAAHLCRDPNLIYILSQTLSESDFSSRAVAALFGSILSCTRQGLSLEPGTVASELLHYNGLDHREYELLRARLLAPAGPQIDLEQAARTVRSLALHRSLKDFLKDWWPEVQQRPTTTPERVPELLSFLIHLAGVQTGEEMRPDALAHEHYARPDIPPPTTGYPSLDDCLSGGLVPQKVVVIGYPSGQGKTTYIANIIAHQIRNRRHSILFTPETSKWTFLTWINATLSGVPWSVVEHRDRFRNAVDEQLVMGWWDEMGRYLLVSELITDLHRMHSVALSYQAQCGEAPTVFVDIVDTVQLKGTENKNEAYRQEAVVATSSDMAKTMGNTWVFTAQVNEATEKALAATNTPPSDFAFRASKGIRNKADFCLIGCRHNGLTPGGGIDLSKDRTVVIHCMKNRLDGSQAGRRVEFEFDGATKTLREARDGLGAKEIPF